MPRDWLLLVCALAALPAHAQICPGGTASTLELDVRVPQMPTLQGGLGSTQIVQRFADATKKPVEHTWPGTWTCLAFDPETKAYALLHRDVMGATPAYAGVTLLPDVGGDIRSLPFADLGHVVLAAPDGRHAVAVIGNGGLVALDFKNLRTWRLGQAPAPMPLTADEARYHKGTKPLTWNREPRDSTSELEPEILKFASPTQLQVSYGKDTARTRAAKRRVQTFDLSQPPVMPSLVKEPREMPDLRKYAR